MPSQTSALRVKLNEEGYLKKSDTLSYKSEDSISQIPSLQVTFMNTLLAGVYMVIIKTDRMGLASCSV